MRKLMTVTMSANMAIIANIVVLAPNSVYMVSLQYADLVGTPIQGPRVSQAYCRPGQGSASSTVRRRFCRLASDAQSDEHGHRCRNLAQASASRTTMPAQRCAQPSLTCRNWGRASVLPLSARSWLRRGGVLGPKTGSDHPVSVINQATHVPRKRFLRPTGPRGRG